MDFSISHHLKRNNELLKNINYTELQSFAKRSGFLGYEFNSNSNTYFKTIDDLTDIEKNEIFTVGLKNINAVYDTRKYNIVNQLDLQKSKNTSEIWKSFKTLDTCKNQFTIVCSHCYYPYVSDIFDFSKNCYPEVNGLVAGFNLSKFKQSVQSIKNHKLYEAKEFIINNVRSKFYCKIKSYADFDRQHALNKDLQKYYKEIVNKVPDDVCKYTRIDYGYGSYFDMCTFRVLDPSIINESFINHAICDHCIYNYLIEGKIVLENYVY